MPAARPVQPPPDPPPALHAQAMDNLRYIRRTMQDAAAFTAVPGWGQVGIGATALVTAALAARQAGPSGWLLAWIGEACVAVAIGVWAMARKARAAGIPLLSGPGRRFASGFALPVVAAAILTAALVRGGQLAPLPGLWMLLYGTAIVSAGAFSVRIVPLLGGCFMLLGALSLFAPLPRDLALGAGFGGLHLCFGVIIARRHGG